MPVPYYLVSSTRLGAEDFQSVLAASGGVLDENHPFSGRVSRGARHVWLYLATEELENRDAEEIAAITGKLGAPPAACILLDVSRTEGSEQLAIEFACAVAKRRRVALDDLHGHVFSSEELLDLLRLGEGFPKV